MTDTVTQEETVNATAETPVAEAPATESEENVSMADMAGYEDSFKQLKPGQFMTGTVLRVDAQGAYIDVGYKSEGYVPAHELSHQKDVAADSVVNVGDKIDVLLVSPSTTQTEFFDKVAGDTKKPHGRFGAKSPAYVARATLRGIKAGRHEIILSTGGRFLVWLDRLCPPLADRLVAWWG